MNLFYHQVRNWMLATTILLAITMLFYLYQQARSSQLAHELLALENQSLEVEKIQKELNRYQKITQKLKTRYGGTAPRHESVTLQATFSETELHQAPSLLKNTYEGNGIFQLEHFSLKTITSAPDNKKASGTEITQPTVEMSLLGNKTFLFFTP